MNERHAIYCHDLSHMTIAPVSYSEQCVNPLYELLKMSAWVQVRLNSEGGGLPDSFVVYPKEFAPKILSYANFKEIDHLLSAEKLEDNVFVILMPSMPKDVDLQLLELIVHNRFDSYLKERNIKPRLEKIVSKNEFNIGEVRADNVQFGSQNTMQVGISAADFLGLIANFDKKPVAEKQSILAALSSRAKEGLPLLQIISLLSDMLNK